MFGLLLKKFRIMLWLDEAQGGGGGTTPSEGETEDGAGDDKAKEPTSKKPDPQEKKFTQAELDAIVSDRLKREQKKAEELAAKAKKDADEAALAKNQEWQQLAETRATELATLTEERDQLLEVKTQAEKYKTALEGLLTETKKTLPKHILPLLDRMDPVDQLDYIAKNSKELNLRAVASYPGTPDDKEKVGLSKEDDEAGRRAVAKVITSSF